MFSLDQIPIFTLYFTILFIIVIKSIKTTKTESSYLIGDRQLSPLLVAISAGAADMSGWLLLGLPGAIYLTGLNQLWIVFGLIIGSYLNWRWVAQPLRDRSYQVKAITLPDFFSKVCNEKSSIVNIFASIVILFFFTIYVASGFVSSAKVFEEYFSINYHLSISITLLIIVLSTMSGGFLTVSWTEFFQGLVMFFVILIIPVLAIFHGAEHNINFMEIFSSNYSNHFNLFYETNFLMILSLLAWGLGYFGQPHILSKFMAMKSYETAIKARRIAIIWMIGGLFFATLIGLLGRVFIPNVLLDSEMVMLNLSQLLLPSFLISLPIIAILSAIFSTASAQLLIVASVVTNDLKLIKNSLTANRVVTLAVAIFASLVALYPNNKILDMVGYAWAGFGASFGPLVLFSLYSKKNIQKETAIAGMMSGMISVIVWNTARFFLPHIEILKLYELLPAFIISFIFIIIVEKFVKTPFRIPVSE